MSELCSICGLHLTSDLVNVKSQGIERLVSASEERKDGKENLFRGKPEIRLHRKCRLIYVESKSIQALKRRREESVGVKEELDNWQRREESVGVKEELDNGQRREESVGVKEEFDNGHSNLQIFDFQNYCLFCNESADEEFKKAQKKRPVKDRIVVCHLMKCTTQEKILNAAETHKDDWSEQVLLRINGIDLQEQHAVYHAHCYAKFCHPYRASGLKRGRCQPPENAEAMNIIYNYLETNLDDRQFCLQDIRNAFPDIELPSDPVIKYNLRKKFGSDIIITSGNIICLLTNCTQVIQNCWYEARQNNDTAEKERIVEAAGKIILEEVTSRIYETNSYPAPNNFLKDVKEDCPPLLMKLLQIIIMDNKTKKETYEKKCVALAHGILSAARPRSFRSPLLLGLSSLIHHKYASRYLIDILSGFGFCATYEETLTNNTAFIASLLPSTEMSRQ